ncbi:MAG: hypothetical protein Q8K62_12310 [Thiobacillus sp.]|nr:hypothetical protein [Thiobacillus sp.]
MRNWHCHEFPHEIVPQQIWHSLGAKTIELIHQNVHVDAVRVDLDTLVLDADLLEAVLSNPEPSKTKEVEIKSCATPAQASRQPEGQGATYGSITDKISPLFNDTREAEESPLFG